MSFKIKHSEHLSFNNPGKLFFSAFLVNPSVIYGDTVITGVKIADNMKHLWMAANLAWINQDLTVWAINEDVKKKFKEKKTRFLRRLLWTIYWMPFHFSKHENKG